jgi:hypothetical protein
VNLYEKYDISRTDKRLRLFEILTAEDGRIDLLISQYAGFVSESSARYLQPGGYLVTESPSVPTDRQARRRF